MYKEKVPSVPIISMFPITPRCTTLQSVHRLIATHLLSVGGLGGVAKFALLLLLLLPRLWFWDDESKSGIKRKQKKRLLTLNTSSSSRIRSSCRDWLLGSTITFCTVPLSGGGQKTHVVNTPPRTNRVKQIWLWPDVCEKREYERLKKQTSCESVFLYPCLLLN